LDQSRLRGTSETLPNDVRRVGIKCSWRRGKEIKEGHFFQHKGLDKGDSLHDKIKGAVKMMQAIKQPVGATVYRRAH